MPTYFTFPVATYKLYNNTIASLFYHVLVEMKLKKINGFK